MPDPATLPIDTSVRIPMAVRRNAERANDMHKAAYTAGDVPPVEGATTTPAPAATPTEVTPPPAATPAPEPAPAPTPENWEHKYNSLKGRYDQAMVRITNMENTLASIAAAPPAAAAPAPAPKELQAKSFVTPELREQFGQEFIDAAAAAARDALQPELEAKNAEIESLKRQLNGVAGVVSQDARGRMLSQLTEQVPNWEQLNTDENFLNWLRLPDAYSGVIRHNLLTQAFERNDTARVLAFFKGFLREEAAVAPVTTPVPAPAAKPGLETFAEPGRGKATSAPVTGAGAGGKPIITRASIASFYADVRAGKFAHNEAEKNRIEKEIWDAQAEGRIQ